MKKREQEEHLSEQIVKICENLQGILYAVDGTKDLGASLSQSAVTLEARLEHVQEDNKWVKEQFLLFADHKDTCDIRESADEGRIVEGLECTCGFNELKLQFETDTRR